MRSRISYLDFDLMIRRADGGYRAQVLYSTAGEASANFVAPFSDLELENFLLRFGRPRRGTRRIGSPEMEAAKTLGLRLYEAVFSGDIRGCWQTSLSEAEAQNAGLRLRLRTAEASELNEIPWEYLYNPSLNCFLSLSEYTPLIRYIDLPEHARLLTVDTQLEILVMISSPADYPGLDIEGEWSRLNKALAGLTDSGKVRLKRLSEPTLSVLQEELRRGQCHILHFIGHGGFDPGTQGGVLVLSDGAGRGRLVAADHLGTILHDHRSLRLVVLNACEGARSTPADPFAGVAQSLVQQGIPAVIAMQFEITDQAALIFAGAFYGAIADEYPVDAALAEARKAIFVAGNDIEWGTPILFLRTPTGQLFLINRNVIRKAEEKKPAIASKKVAWWKQGEHLAKWGCVTLFDDKLVFGPDPSALAWIADPLKRIYGKFNPPDTFEVPLHQISDVRLRLRDSLVIDKVIDIIVGNNVALTISCVGAKSLANLIRKSIGMAPI